MIPSAPHGKSAIVPYAAKMGSKEQDAIPKYIKVSSSPV